MLPRGEYHFFVCEQCHAIAHGKRGDAEARKVGRVRRVDEDVLLVVAIHQITLGEHQTVTAMFETRHDTSRVSHSGDGRLSVRFQLHQIELERPICAFRFHGHSIAFHQLPVAV